MTTNTNATAILNTLSADSQNALAMHFRSQIFSVLASTLGGAPVSAPAATDTTTESDAPAKRKPGRPRKDPSAVVEAPAKKTVVKKPAKKTDDSEAPKRGRGRPLMSEAEKAAKKAEKAKAVTVKASSKEATASRRALSKDGRTASQVIRDFDEKYEEVQPAADVVAHCAKLGLEVAPALVYNVRQNVKKAAAAAEAEAKKAAKKAEKMAAKAAAEKSAKKEEKAKPAKAEKPAKVKSEKAKPVKVEAAPAEVVAEPVAEIVAEDTVAVNDTVDVTAE